MRTQTHKPPLAFLAAVAVAAAALAWAGAANVRAQASTEGRSKVSADLRQKLSQTSKVSVVIKAAG
ncbi:MAG TPA: hypothetical protein VF508_11375, partial [Pyrinomonadaceae bacterium]